MSTDLQLQHELPRLRISADDQTAESNSNQNDGVVTTRSKPDQLDIDDEGCRTPTSEESRIPAILTCPPAPRKPKATFSFKRKLSDDKDQIIKVMCKDDLEAFFRSMFPPKKRCHR